MTNHLKAFVESKPFLHAIVSVIVLAGVVAGLETSPAIMAQHGALLHGLDKIILGIFVIEAVLKMAMHGRQPWRYFADGWNVFDFLIVVICLLPVGGPFAAVLRLARALQLLRLVSAITFATSSKHLPPRWRICSAQARGQAELTVWRVPSAFLGPVFTCMARR